MARLKLLLRFLKTSHCSSIIKSPSVSIRGISHCQTYFCSNKSEELNSSVSPSPLNIKSQTDFSDCGLVLLPSFNLAAYADQSPLLQEFIKLGVELYKIDRNPEVGEFLLSLDFEKNVKPYLLFLHDNGVLAENFGQLITKFPLLFKEDLNDLEVRVNYLKSKRFDKNMISNIITKNPKWLSIPVKTVDGRLGYLQQTFKLKGDEVRKMVSQVPALGTTDKLKIMQNVFTLKEEMNLEDHELKKLVCSTPVLLKKNSNDLISTYDFLTRVMSVPQYLILKQPQVLNTRKFKIRERHQFLQSLGRAQYNPLLPGYVSLSSLTSVDDVEFCERIAKTSIHTYNEFLKTL